MPARVCPHCGSESTKVNRTKKAGSMILRWILCKSCGGTSRTRETKPIRIPKKVS